MNEVEIVREVIAPYITREYGYKYVNKPIAELKCGEMTCEKKAGIVGRADLIIMTPHGAFVCEVKFESNTKDGDRYQAPGYLSAIPNRYGSCLLVLPDDFDYDDIGKYFEAVEKNGWDGKPIYLPDMTGSGKHLQKISDIPRFLATLRNKLWSGQSYDLIYDELAKILLCKWYAEREHIAFTSLDLHNIWSNARIEFNASGAQYGEIARYPDNRLDTVVEYINNYDVASNSEIVHYIHNAWQNHSANKEQGQYYTPPLIRRFMCSYYKAKPGDHICDPCGGTGSFLLQSLDISDDCTPSLIHYYEIDGLRAFKSASQAFIMYRHPKTGKTLDGIDKKKQDSLNGPWETPNCSGKQYMDVIYTNVPFGVKISDVEILKQYKTAMNGEKQKKSVLSQVLFIEKCIDQLSDTGRFATVVDKGVVTNEQLKNARKLLSSMAFLELVVELPTYAFDHFAGTTFPTYLLFFTKREISITKFIKINNIGYSNKGLIDANSNPLQEDGRDVGFAPHLEDYSWECSDWPKILNGEFPLHEVPYKNILETGDWHYGPHECRSKDYVKLGDIANLVQEPWSGANELNPTIDRTYRIITNTHLRPKKKALTLYNGCILMSRLVSEEHPPCCGVVDDIYAGAGCTNENYIIRPNDKNDLIDIWWCINFDTDAIRFIQSNSRGQGRGRILENDLLNMPFKKIPVNIRDNVIRIFQRLSKKSKLDMMLRDEILVII
jgi:hypothetical protein